MRKLPTNQTTITTSAHTTGTRDSEIIERELSYHYNLYPVSWLNIFHPSKDQQDLQVMNDSNCSLSYIT